MKNTKRKAIEVGQVWRDCDKRMNARHIKIIRTDGDVSTLFSGFVYAACCTKNGVGLSLRETRIRANRMYPHSTGFELVTP